MLYRSNGHDHHWLTVDLVGVQSNCDGIGARVIATAGDLRQMRQILGGLGYYQDEMVAHFGLGARDRVESLEVRGTSGQVDELYDIPADQRIRVFEGRTTYHVVEPTAWEGTLRDADTLVIGSRVDLQDLVDLEGKQWQRVAIPVSEPHFAGELTGLACTYAGCTPVTINAWRRASSS